MNKDDSQVVTPKITVEQALTRLLDLIRTSKTVEEFTPERVEQVMQVPIEWARDGSDRFGYGELVTAQWNLGFGADRTGGANFELSLNPIPPGASPEMTGLCQMDFDRFTEKLEELGFSRSHNYDFLPPPIPGEEHLHRHARLLSDSFQGPGMFVDVFPQGENRENAGHFCVQMVLIYGRRLP